jgi:hypothetical protein
MSRKFQRLIENFICENCGEPVSGDGYTNHCHVCLWSKHVDINPGDREADCQGLMKPVSVDKKRGNYRILHSCVKCDLEKWNKTNPEDNFEVILQIAADQSMKL